MFLVLSSLCLVSLGLTIYFFLTIKEKGVNFRTVGVMISAVMTVVFMLAQAVISSV